MVREVCNMHSVNGKCNQRLGWKTFDKLFWRLFYLLVKIFTSHVVIFNLILNFWWCVLSVFVPVLLKGSGVFTLAKIYQFIREWYIQTQGTLFSAADVLNNFYRIYAHVANRIYYKYIIFAFMFLWLHASFWVPDALEQPFPNGQFDLV